MTRMEPQPMPRAWPMTRRTMWGIWVEETTTIRSPSIQAKETGFSMWQCWTAWVSKWSSKTR